MKFVTLCMSPAIDVTIRLEHWPHQDEVFKDVEDHESVGGKGINVARWLALRGHEVICGGLLGEENREIFDAELSKYGIQSAFLSVPGMTRRNEMITTPQGNFKLNRKAFPQCAERITAEAILSHMEQSASDSIFQKGTIWILSGSLPPCCEPIFYKDFIQLLKDRSLCVVLDTSGGPLRYGIEARPDLIKPNAEECAELLGFSLHTSADFQKATALLQKSVPSVIISDGAQGAWFNGHHVPSPSVDVLDTTAAGDTLLAEFCSRISLGEFLQSASKWAVSAGAAATTMPGALPAPFSLVEGLYQSLP